MNHECEYCGGVIRGDDNDCKWCSTRKEEKTQSKGCFNLVEYFGDEAIE